LVTKHFGGQALEIAWMESSWGIGVVVGGLVLSAWGGFRRRMLTSLAGLVGMGIGVLMIGLMPASVYALAVATLFVVGFANPITNGPLLAVVQATVDPEMQGRVFTLIGSVASAMTPLGLIIAGPVADRFGVQSWFIVGGIATVVMGLGAFFVPAIVRFEEGRVPKGGTSAGEPATIPTSGE
jgi:DHA3 family macrolide efflux protein-like MFS transporter